MPQSSPITWSLIFLMEIYVIFSVSLFINAATLSNTKIMKVWKESTFTQTW